MGVSHPFVAPPHLQSLPYCNTIARPFRNICPPHQPPFCMPYTIQYWRWQYQYRVKAKSLTAPKGYPPWCLRHAGALAWRREPVLCACTRVCWCVSRRIFTYVYYIIIYIYIHTSHKHSGEKSYFPATPTSRTAGWQSLDDSRAQRDQLRTAVARIGLLDPQLASCKREASEQTVQAASWPLKARQLEMPAAAQTARPRLAHQGSSKSARAASACTHRWR